MSEAPAATPAPERTLEEISAAHAAAVAGAAAEIARLRQAMAAAARSGTPLPPLSAALISTRIADFEKVMLDDQSRLAEAVRIRTFQQMREARQAPAGPAPESPRHRRRVPRQRDGRPAWPRSAGALIPAVAAALRHPAQHAWTAHQVAVTAATALGVPALVAASVTLAARHASVPAPGSTAAAPAAPAVAAPGSPPALVIVRPRVNAVTSGPPAAGPAPPAGSAPPAATPGPQAAAPQAAVTGTLSAGTAELDLGAGYSAAVTLSASGAPVGWHAVCPGHDLIPGPRQGVAAPGRPAVFSVGVTAAAQVAGGTADCTFWPGRVRVTITWAALAVPGASAAASVPPPSPGT